MRDLVDREKRLQSIACAALAIILLMWPALVNRQPFFFSDTSSYVRAGDVVAHVAWGSAADTVWTPAHPVSTPPTAEGRGGASVPSGQKTAVPPHPARGNDPANGFVMAGRSPYFGAIVWLAWIASSFWLFVVAQAAIAYFLIGLALRCFGIDRPVLKLAVSAILGLLTPLALYNGMLLADALAGFGVVALLILIAPAAPIARWERLSLFAILLVSVMSHLTHLVMLGAMLALLGGLVLTRHYRWREVRSAIAVGCCALVLGALSIVLASRAIEHRYGRPPVLVPLMTARFVADGPGRDFIGAGCGGRDFAVCSLPIHDVGSTEFLWSTNRERGTFLVVPVPMRRRLAEEDRAFAAAVFAAYPIRVAGQAAWNSLLQISNLKVDVVDETCFADPACTNGQFPEPVARAIAATPAGAGAWPVRLMNAVSYSSFAVAILALLLVTPRLMEVDRPVARRLLMWIAMVALAMAINSFLGGAVSEPQSRYHTRMSWIIPLLALIAGSVFRTHAVRSSFRRAGAIA